MPQIRSALESGSIEEAMAICSKTRGPIASIFSAGLMRIDRGVEAVEKSIMSAGTIEMAFLEKNLIWLSTIIGMAPMLGFTGTVWGMIAAFDSIMRANDISPSVVAGGISQALLTTLFGLIVAMIIQICSNFFISRIDKLVIEMEESSVDFIDTISAIEAKKKNQ